LTLAYSNGHSTIALQVAEAMAPYSTLISIPPENGIFLFAFGWDSHFVKTASYAENYSDLNIMLPKNGGMTPL
jgi:hypothetical protein